MNRRHWLSLVLASSAATLLPAPLRGSTARDKAGIRYGLFFDPSMVDSIRDNFLNDPGFAGLRAWFAAFDYEAEIAWMDNDLRYNDQLYDIQRLRKTAQEMAFLAMVTGEARPRRLAMRAVREIMRFERWDFFMDAGIPIAVQRASETTLAVALVADFLGNHLDDQERRQWLRTMWERGCLPCFRTIEDIRDPQSVAGWHFDPESTYFEHRPGNRTDMNRRPEITFNTNLRAIPASALVIGTVIYEQEFGPDETTRTFREMGIWGLEDFRKFFKLDGSYEEEVNYANYTALHIAQAVIVLRRHGGPDMTDIINWNGYIDFLLNVSMPTDVDPYAVVNWGDSGVPPTTGHADPRTALPMWIGRETRSGLAQGYALTMAGTRDFWSALWYDPSVREKFPADGPRLWVSASDRVVARTGFGKDHLVVAMRSGPPSNHEHADRNSLIVKCFGQELVADPIRPPYTYDDPAWRLRLTEGHSAILIDGRGHEHPNGVEGTNSSNSFARIVEHADNGHYATWISDASQPYRLVDTNIKSVVRTVGVLYDVPAVVIVDRITKWKAASTVQARFFGYNYDGQGRLSAAKDTFEIHRPGAVLRGLTACTSSSSCHTGQLDIPEETARRHPFVDVTTAPSTDLTLVTVLILGRSVSGLPEASLTRQQGSFLISVAGEALRVEDGAIRIS